MAMAQIDTDIPMTNEQRKAEALRRKAEKAHAWRVQVWAQSELRIRQMQAALSVLGEPEVELFEPRFDDSDMLRHYAEMSLA